MKTLVLVGKVIMGALILAMLAGGAYFYADAWFPRTSTTKLSRVDPDFNVIGSCLKTYRLQAGFYPTTEQGLEALVRKPDTDPVPGRWTKIADRVPTDPWNNPYLYRRLSDEDERGFELYSAGRDGLLGTNDDLSSLNPGTGR